jgi:hypothetical protein
MWNAPLSARAWIHALGCTKVIGTNASSRHAAVKETIIHRCERNGIPTSDEPVVYHDGIPTKRCDIRIVLPTEDVCVDVTIANAACRSHAGKPLPTIERIKTGVHRRLGWGWGLGLGPFGVLVESVLVHHTVFLDRAFVDLLYLTQGLRFSSCLYQFVRA